MKGADFQRLARKYLLPHLPGFGSKGGLLVAEPLEYLLRGFSFEPSGFDPSSFYMSVFVQPPYVPSTYVCFHYGNRLGFSWSRPQASEEWYVMGKLLACMESEGLPFLRRFRNPADFADKAAQITGSLDDPYLVETVASSLVLVGRYQDALEEIDRLHRITMRMNPKLSWPREIDRRAQQVRESMSRDPQEAVALLNAWRDQTVHNLRLEKTRKP